MWTPVILLTKGHGLLTAGPLCTQASQYDSLFDGMDWYKGLSTDAAGTEPAPAAEVDSVKAQKERLQAVRRLAV